MTNAPQFIFKIDSCLICFAVLSLHENLLFEERVTVIFLEIRCTLFYKILKKIEIIDESCLMFETTAMFNLNWCCAKRRHILKVIPLDKVCKRIERKQTSVFLTHTKCFFKIFVGCFTFNLHGFDKCPMTIH